VLTGNCCIAKSFIAILDKFGTVIYPLIIEKTAKFGVNLCMFEHLMGFSTAAVYGIQV